MSNTSFVRVGLGRLVCAVAVISLGGFFIPAFAAERPPEVLEVVGIQVGMSIDEVRARLEQRKIQVYVDKAQFPNSQESFVVRLRGVSPNQDVARELIVIQFAPPPNEARAVAVARNANWPLDQGPAIDNLSKTMIDKFGAPARKAGKVHNSSWVWIWGKSGSPGVPDPQITCETYLRFFEHTGSMSLNALTQNITPGKFTAPLNAGCASGVHATLQGDGNGIRAVRLTTVAVDFATADKAIRATAEYMAKLQGAATDRQRDAAKKQKSEI